MNEEKKSKKKENLTGKITVKHDRKVKIAQTLRDNLKRRKKITKNNCPNLRNN